MGGLSGHVCPSAVVDEQHASCGAFLLADNALDWESSSVAPQLNAIGDYAPCIVSGCCHSTGSTVCVRLPDGFINVWRCSLGRELAGLCHRLASSERLERTQMTTLCSIIAGLYNPNKTAMACPKGFRCEIGLTRPGLVMAGIRDTPWEPLRA